MRTLLAVAVVCLTLFLSPPSFALMTGRSRGGAKSLSPGTPYAVGEAIATRDVTGPMFCPMDWADYLVWRTQDGVQPLVSTHVHAVSDQVWADSRQIEAGSPRWLTLADQYGIRHLIMDRTRQPRLLHQVSGQPRCRVAYEDSQAIWVEIRPPKINENRNANPH